MIHPTAEVQSTSIGVETNIWQFTVVLEQAAIGKNTNICSHCFIENDVVVGDHVTIKSGVQLWDGCRVEDYAFIGPNVTFTNDLYPKSKNTSFKLLTTTVSKGAAIGANSTLLAGITIGQYALVGAGSLVTKNIPEFTVWYGSPAEFKRTICQCENELSPHQCFECK